MSSDYYGAQAGELADEGATWYPDLDEVPLDCHCVWGGAVDEDDRDLPGWQLDEVREGCPHHARQGRNAGMASAATPLTAVVPGQPVNGDT